MPHPQFSHKLLFANFLLLLIEMMKKLNIILNSWTVRIYLINRDFHIFLRTTLHFLIYRFNFSLNIDNGFPVYPVKKN